jgi:predicted lipoprotein with Yx(FWY)xxD motif
VQPFASHGKSLLSGPITKYEVIFLLERYGIAISFFALCFLSSLAMAENPDNFTINVSENKFLGTYLVNQSGFTLYYFSDDAKGAGGSTCYDECSVLWPPFYADNMLLPEDLKPMDFATITRTDGSKQTTFKGWPLYLYSRDREAGDTFGSQVKNLWHVVDPMNQPQLI